LAKISQTFAMTSSVPRVYTNHFDVEDAAADALGSFAGNESRAKSSKRIRSTKPGIKTGWMK